MSDESVPRRAPHLAAMFQKAYAQAVTLQAADEQIAAMLQQRQRLEAEIRNIQSQINLEFDRVLAAGRKAHIDLAGQIAEAPQHELTIPRMKIAMPPQRATAAAV
jgi:hypothetical protein